MEFVQTILSGIGIEVLKSGWSFICDCVNYKKNLDQNMQSLKRKRDELSSREEDIRAELSNAHRLDGKKQKTEVDTWSKNVRDKISEVQAIEQRVAERRHFSRSEFLKLVEKNIQEVDQLMDSGRFPEGLFIDVHQDRQVTLVTTPLVGQSVKDKNLKKIWDFLIDDGIHRIGVYGMGGIGKTTIATHIHNIVKESTSTLGCVYWVTVSQESSIHKLQHEIAKIIGLDRYLLEEQDEKKRAAMLFEELTKRKKFVLILDDMWKDFPMEKIGIPIRHGAGKLIVTTRSVEVCRKMNCQKISKVERLSTMEARELFMETLKPQTVLAPEVKEVAESIVEECAGLPLAIITTAGSMKGVDDIHEWRNALNELREPTKCSSNMEDEVFKILRFSYDRLNDEKVQESLLYCALFPEDRKIPRENLIVYLIREGLVDEMETRQAKFDRGHTLLNKLENACLLERLTNIEGKICVKMHDVIRDMAINMTRVNGRFMVKAGVNLIEFPNEREWSENLERVSIMNANVKGRVSCISPKCPKLYTLLLQSNSIKKIPDSFFVHMQNLRVLDLSYTLLRRLPKSISDLENLRALLLNHCDFLEYVPSVAKLTELRELDLRSSAIEELPHGMENLVNLKCFQLGFYNYYGPQQLVFPSGVLANLSHLQSLKVGGLKIINDADVEVISSLSRLEVLHTIFDNREVFKSYVKSQHWQSLTHYYLQINDKSEQKWPRDTCSRELFLDSCEDFIGGVENLLLPTNMQELEIHLCHNLTSLLDISSSLKSLRELKKCFIWRCGGIKHLFWPLSVSLEEEDLFQSLTALIVFDMKILIFLFNLEGTGAAGVGGAPSKCGSFSNLKLVRVARCPKLKYVFTQGLVQHYLQNLEDIEVWECDEMENIIIADEEEKQGEIVAAKQEEISCPRLQKLLLEKLPSLKSIWKGRLVCNSLQQIHVYQCPMLKRLPLSPHCSQTSSTLEIIEGEKDWLDSLEWDPPEAKSAFQPLFVHISMSFLTHGSDSKCEARRYDLM